MKKSFLYAIAIAAALTGCSSENDMVTNDNTTVEGTEPIALSIAAPTMSVATRGTGTVGSADNTNCWMGQKVNVYMFNKGTLTPTKMSSADQFPIFENTPLKTPVGTPSGELTREDNLRSYYPISGASDFWGYRTDGAQTANPSVSGNQLVVPFKIDGSQDILLGAPDRSHWPADSKHYFSAYSARTDATYGNPTLIFKHQLTRLVFTGVALNNLKEYSENATQISTSMIEMDENWQKVMTDYSLNGNINLGVYIDAIQIKSLTTGKLIIADITTNQQGIQWDQNSSDYVSLQKRPDNDVTKNLMPLGIFQVNDKVAKQIGEALLVAPSDRYEIKVKMHQYKLKYSPEYVATHAIARPYVYYELEWTLPNLIDLTKINKDAAGKPGYSYTLNLGISGAEPSLLKATLEPWIDGGTGQKPLE